MIALVFTILVAVYVLGPDLLARWVLSFVVPRKNLVLSKSEEITRGILWSIIPFLIAWIFRHTGPWAFQSGAKFDLQVFFSGLYSGSYFEENRNAFFGAAGTFWRFNLCLLLRLYATVLIASVIFNCLIVKYGKIRRWLEGKNSLFWSVLGWLLATFVLPRIAEWHLVLSPVLLASKKMTIEVDILTKSNILYAGRLADKVLTGTGDLQSVTLRNPKRFKRGEYLRAKKSGDNLKIDDFWKEIPGELFVIVASEISTVNVRHIPAVPQFAKKYPEIAGEMRKLRLLLEKAEQSPT